MEEAMTTAELTDTSEDTRAAWDKIARGYDEFVTPTHMWLGNEGLDRAGFDATEPAFFSIRIVSILAIQRS